ncbi:MAG: hypothetical protein SH850_21285, partial [Planctomycetaceae bacterium]|nr:hypothetical protein [Planctomycetaceae bacterium]
AKESADYQARILEDAVDRHNQAAKDHNQRLIDEDKKRNREYEDLLKARADMEIRWLRKVTEAAQEEADKRLAIAKAEHAAKVQLIEGADGGQLLNKAKAAIDPRAVAQQVGRQRGEQAAAEFTKQNVGGVDAADANAVRRFNAQRNQARAQAEQAGFRDVASGRAGGHEVLGAQNALLQASAQQAQAAGLVSSEMVAALREAANSDMQKTMELQRQATEIQQIRQAIVVSGSNTRDSRASAIRKGFRG